MRLPSALAIALVFAACGTSPIAPEPPPTAEPPPKPVPVEEEEPLPPEVPTDDDEPAPPLSPKPGGISRAPCDIPLDGGLYGAERAYPGRKLEELVRVYAIVESQAASQPRLAARFSYIRSSPLFLSDGKVGTLCSQGSTVMFVDP